MGRVTLAGARTGVHQHYWAADRDHQRHQRVPAAPAIGWAPPPAFPRSAPRICATLLLLQGVHARVVMETLGHSQIGLTMDTYSHKMPSLQRNAADLIGRGVGGCLRYGNSYSQTRTRNEIGWTNVGSLVTIEHEMGQVGLGGRAPTGLLITRFRVRIPGRSPPNEHKTGPSQRSGFLCQVAPRSGLPHRADEPPFGRWSTHHRPNAKER